MLMRKKISVHFEVGRVLRREANVFGNLKNKRQQNKTAGVQNKKQIASLAPSKHHHCLGHEFNSRNSKTETTSSAFKPELGDQGLF